MNNTSPDLHANSLSLEMQRYKALEKIADDIYSRGSASVKLDNQILHQLMLSGLSNPSEKLEMRNISIIKAFLTKKQVGERWEEKFSNVGKSLNRLMMTNRVALHRFLSSSEFMQDSENKELLQNVPVGDFIQQLEKRCALKDIHLGDDYKRPIRYLYNFEGKHEDLKISLISFPFKVFSLVKALGMETGRPMSLDLQKLIEASYKENEQLNPLKTEGEEAAKKIAGREKYINAMISASIKEELEIKTAAENIAEDKKAAPILNKKRNNNVFRNVIRVAAATIGFMLLPGILGSSVNQLKENNYKLPSQQPKIAFENFGKAPVIEKETVIYKTPEKHITPTAAVENSQVKTDTTALTSFNQNTQDSTTVINAISETSKICAADTTASMHKVLTQEIMLKPDSLQKFTLSDSLKTYIKHIRNINIF